MNLPIDFTFDYERPNLRKSRMRTPAALYLPQTNAKTGKRASGMLYISTKWLDHHNINGNEIAMQVKDRDNTFVIFHPPKNAPRFFSRSSSPRLNTVAYACTDVVTKLMDIFSPDPEATTVELWLENVGTFKSSIVCRLRYPKADDKFYRY